MTPLQQWSMLKALKEIFTPHEPTTTIRVGSSFPVEVPQSELRYSLFQQPECNTAEARKQGIQPVHLHQLLEQFPRDQVLNSVLFDNSPSDNTTGNHWRILELDDKLQSVTIQLCGGPFGNHDTRIPPITLSQYDILFTGMSTQQYERRGHPIPLEEVNERIQQAGYGTPEFVYPIDIHWIGQTIYWADGEGKLTPTE